MSTPVDLNVVMPYGVTVRSKGTAIPSIVGTHPKQNNGVSLSLPAGPCRVAASWEGAEDMRLVVQNQSEATSRTVATIPSGGVRTVMVSVGAIAGDSVYLTGAKSTGVTGTIEVYPLDMQQ